MVSWQWNWNSLSKIVAQINQSSTWTASLLVPDAPAVFLSRQSNAGVEMPYECVVSGVGLIGLTEPALPTVAATPSGSLAYQVREYLQAFIARDRTYLDQVFRRGHKKLSRAGAKSTTVIEVWQDAPERSLVLRSGPAIDCGVDERCPTRRGTPVD